MDQGRDRRTPVKDRRWTRLWGQEMDQGGDRRTPVRDRRWTKATGDGLKGQKDDGEGDRRWTKTKTGRYQ